MGAIEIMMEMDSLEVVATMKRQLFCSHRLVGLVSTIKAMADGFSSFHISHVFREQNMAANYIFRANYHFGHLFLRYHHFGYFFFKT